MNKNPTPLKKSDKRFTPQLVFGAVWILLSLSLAGWWIIFSLKQLETLKSIQHEKIYRLVRQQTMLLQEGGFLVALLLTGGLALFYYILREKRQGLLIRQFFAAFTHEVKTSLASLRLQAESLDEDLADRPEERELTQRLVKDTVRLELQLENSLYLSRADRGELFFEHLSIQQIVRSLSHQWPELRWQINGDATVHADRRALESLLKNLFQNALVHGHAKNIHMLFINLDQRRIEIRIEDDGNGFSGEYQRLGEIFIRHTARSGTGLGLYLVKLMAERLQGRAEFSARVHGSGFQVSLFLPGQLIESPMLELSSAKIRGPA
jgi:signal transduction histidine kinase